MTEEDRTRRGERDPELYEGIRIIGAEPADDAVAPGRSVFADEGSFDDEPQWLDVDDTGAADEYDDDDDYGATGAYAVLSDDLDDPDDADDLDDWSTLDRAGQATPVLIGDEDWDDDDQDADDFFTMAEEDAQPAVAAPRGARAQASGGGGGSGT